jgi:protein dithiol oxidoreductase (disulfide-forming)
MDRRLFLLAGSAWTLGAFSQPPEPGWKDGVHYVTLPSGQPTAHRDGAVEVAEAFSYTCIHCYRFEPYLRVWLQSKPTFVTFVRLPSQWDDRHRAHAQLYYTLKALGRNDLDRAAFAAIHETKNPLFATDHEETLALQVKFVQEHGVPTRAFIQAYNSRTVSSNLQEDAEFLKQFEITETPAIVVDGKYMTDSDHLRASAEGDENVIFDKLIKLTNYLVSLER